GAFHSRRKATSLPLLRARTRTISVDPFISRGSTRSCKRSLASNSDTFCQTLSAGSLGNSAAATTRTLCEGAGGSALRQPDKLGSATAKAMNVYWNVIRMIVVSLRAIDSGDFVLLVECLANMHRFAQRHADDLVAVLLERRDGLVLPLPPRHDSLGAAE